MMPYVFPVPRQKRATPARCAVLARRLARIANALEKGGVRVARVGRLRAGATVLARVAARRSFPTSKGDRRALANAIRDSHEFLAIRVLLGATGFAGMASDVQKAMKGTLDRTEPSRSAYQFQSQLWVGSVFHAAGLTPAVPQKTTTKSPDYIIDVEGTQYGVEVKRPTKAANITKAVDEAYEQLRDYDIAGGVAIDVSDCLDDALVFAHDADRTRPPYEALDAAFSALYHQVSDYLIDSATRRPSPVTSRLFFAIVYLHGWRWFRKRPGGPELFSATQVGRFVSAKGNLRYWDVDKIRVAYAAGLIATGLYVTRETSEIL